MIVNHGQTTETVAQLSAYYRDAPELFARTDWLVVHNGGDPVPDFSALDDEQAETLARVRILTSANRGFGAAITLAHEASGAPFLLSLNADLLPEPGFLAGLHALVDEESVHRDVRPRAGIFGFRLLNADGSPQGSVGRFPTLAGVLGGLLRPRATRKYLPTDLQRRTSAPWVTGACLLVARDCLEAVGCFDEQFFMYYEDVDLCRRVWNAGWQVLHEPRLAMRHFYPYHSRSLSYRMVYRSRAGLLRYFWKHRPRWEFRLLGAIVRGECRLRSMGTDASHRQAWRMIAAMARDHCHRPAEAVVDPTEFS